MFKVDQSDSQIDPKVCAFMNNIQIYKYNKEMSSSINFIININRISYTMLLKVWFLNLAYN